MADKNLVIRYYIFRLQFTGYDISNLLPHITGEVTHMFPTDGGTIKTQRNEIPTGKKMSCMSA